MVSLSKEFETPALYAIRKLLEASHRAIKMEIGCHAAAALHVFRNVQRVGIITQ